MKMAAFFIVLLIKRKAYFTLLYLGNDSLESLGIVHSEVSENLTVELDTCLSEVTHQN